MKKLVLIIISFLFIMCSNNNNSSNEKTYLYKDYSSLPTVISNSGNLFKVMEIDSCEYILYGGYRLGYMAHKGNCKFCEKRKNE